MKSIRSKVFAAILLITLVTSLAVTFLFYRRSAHMIEENYSTDLQMRTVRAVETLDVLFQNIYHVNVNASCDKELKGTLQAYLSGRDEGGLEDLAKLLEVFRSRNASMDSMYLLVPQAHVLVTSEEYPAYKKGVPDDVMDAVVQAAGQAGPAILEDMANEDAYFLSFVETVEDEGHQVLGYLLSNIEEHLLYYDYLTGIDDGMVKEAVLLNRNGRVVTSLDQKQMGSVYENAETYGQWLSKEEAIYSYYEAPFSQCGLLVVVEKAAVLEELIVTRRYFFGILILFLALSLIPATGITSAIYKPLGRLTAAMQKVSEGELGTRAEVASRDEIGMLAIDFNRMLDRIEELIHQLLEEEKQRKDAELEALQYQITPHFMYNTLNSIKCSAMLKGEQEIGEIIGDFIDLLQACINKKGAFLTVAEDIRILENYIRLQEFRYGGQFHVQYEIQPETRDCLVPRLVLQPLVENALLHGIDMKVENSKLAICSQEEEGVLYLKVSDNGRGMTKGQIEKLLNNGARKTKGLTAVGIPNVRDRLELYYGSSAGITYESSEKGTTAIIYLPVTRNT